MNRPPPFPGPPPWWPSTWVVGVGFPVAGIIAAVSFGYPWAIGSLCGSLVCLLFTLWARWRFERWHVRHKAFAAWLKQEIDAGRFTGFEIRVNREL